MTWSAPKALTLSLFRALCARRATLALVSCVTTASTLSFAEPLSSLSSASDLNAIAANNAANIATLWGWLEPFVERPFFDSVLALSPNPRFADAIAEAEPQPWTVGLDWFSSDFNAGRRYRFADPRNFSLLRRYTTPGSERYPSTYLLFSHHLDPARQPLVPQLDWSLDETRVDYSTPFAGLTGAQPGLLPLVRQKRCAAWAMPRPVVVTGLGAEYDRLPLVDCEGAIELFAIDRVSVLARVPNTPNPGYPLPDSPNPPPSWPDEWIDGVRLLHPRLLWVVQRIGEAFPRRKIQIMSGYRRDGRLNSPHRLGRALDIQVSGVEDADLFAFCLSLKDVGCGYYPFHPFVHIDVRAAVNRPVYWVDASMPGEPSKYVDSWPYVIQSGALAGAGSD